MPVRPRRTPAALAALTSALLITATASAVVTAASTAASAATIPPASTTVAPPATTPPATTSTSRDGGAPVPGTVVQSWGFEDGSLAGFTPANGTALRITGIAQTGRYGLGVTGMPGGTQFGPVLNLTFDTSRLVPEGLYELNVPIFIPAGGRATTFRLSAPGLQGQPVQVWAGRWTPVSLRFVWRSTTTRSMTATLSTSTECWGELPQPASEFAVDDVLLRAALTPGSGGGSACPRPTTTTTTTRSTTSTTTTTSSVPTTTTTSSVPTTTTTTTTGSTPPRCRVNYVIASQWPGGFQSNAVVTNTAATPLSDWTLTLTFGDGQKITQAWAVGSWSQTGPDVWFTAPSWATTLAPGASSTVGMMGSWWGVNNPPTRILVNGQPCDGDQPTTTTTTTGRPATTTTTTGRPTTTTTRTTARDGCTWVMAVSAAATGTIQPSSDSLIIIRGYGLGGMYPDGTITWGSDTTRVTGVTGVTSWSQSGRVVSLSGLQWSGGDPREASLRISGTAVSQLPTSVKVNVMTCTYGL